MSKLYLITGTSSGLGRALAEAVLQRGDSAVVTARKLESVSDLVDKYGARALATRLDVTDATDRQATVKAATERFGHIDVLVNNAGQGSLGAIEEFSSEQIRQHFEINCFGVIEMTRAVLPHMRQQRSGHILNITSIAGQVSMGGFALYCATKFAIEGFSEGLRGELASLGIRVTIVEPGAFRTRFAGATNMRAATPMQDYQSVVEPLRKYFYGNDGKQPGDPHKAAQVMIRVVESNDPPLRIMLGKDAYDGWEKKYSTMNEEIAKWRSVGEATAIDGSEMRPIGS